MGLAGVRGSGEVKVEKTVLEQQFKKLIKKKKEEESLLCFLNAGAAKALR